MTDSLSISSLSQANQAYITKMKSPSNTIKGRTIGEFRDQFIKTCIDKNPKNFKEKLKVNLIAVTSVLAGLGLVSILKNPQKIKKAFDSIVNDLLYKKNQKNFNHEKIFNEPIDLNRSYERIRQKVSKVKLNLGFDEKTVTDTELLEKIKANSLIFDPIDFKDKLRKDPNLLHLFNLMVGEEKNFGAYLFNENLTIDEMETFFKMLHREGKFSKFGALYPENAIKCIQLTGVLDEMYQKCGIKKNYKQVVVGRFVEKAGDNFDDYLKFIASLKKGTIINDLYSQELAQLTRTSAVDYRKARKFYEALKPQVQEKLTLSGLQNLLELKDIKSTEVSKILNQAPKEVLKQIKNSADLISYVEFKEFCNIKNINELSLEQRKKLLKKLVSSNSFSFGKEKNTLIPILPTNQKEYCKLMDKLAKSIGVDTKPLTPEELLKFNKGIKNIEQSIQNVDLNNAKFELQFTRNDFVKEVLDKLEGLTDLEKNQVMDYFGFEIKDGILKGYPINVNNGEKLAEIQSKEVKKVIEKIRPIVNKFSIDNKVVVHGATQEFSDDVNKLLQGIPELRPIFEKMQHHTHSFTLDIHTFKVLKDVCSNPKFSELSADDKKVLQIASLLHDITKLEGKRDVMHPIESAFDAFYIIQKLNLPENQQLKIYELIKTHNWLQQLNNADSKMVENIAQDIAFDSRHSNTFEMAKILCEADLKSVKRDNSFFRAHKNTLQEMSAKVDSYIDKLHKTQIFLPQTRIPKASNVIDGKIKSKDRITNTVLYMDDLSDDLSKYGFDKGTTKENLTALVHALEYDEQMSKFDTFSVVDNEALLSTSFINPKEYKVFRKQGLILDVNSNDIHAGYERDFGTGYSKSIELLKQDYLFSNRLDTEGNITFCYRSRYRDFISKKIQEQANLTPEEYYQKLASLQDCKSLTDIEKIDKDFANTLLDVFNDMHKGKRKGGRNYNEILVSRPKIQGVFAYDEDYERIPEFLRKYAQDNDLPIIIFGKAA